MQTILLTCGRGTYSLMLARAFHAGGHKVLVADAWPRSLCRHSAAVAHYFHVPSPAGATDAWVEAIGRIVKQHRVDLIVPVYEEVFYLAKAMGRLADPPPLFAPDFQTLMSLHDKWLFNQTAKALGLRVPETALLTSRDDLLHEFSRGGRDKAFKPVYSRFATQTLVRPPRLDLLDNIEPTPRRPGARTRRSASPIAAGSRPTSPTRPISATASARRWSIGVPTNRPSSNGCEP
jgi:hypothetical protein